MGKAGKTKKKDTRVSLAPLSAEEALRGLLEVKPSPKRADQDGKDGDKLPLKQGTNDKKNAE